MAKSDKDSVQIVNELWQKIFNLTQDEKITAISSDIKAYSGDHKWIIHVPGLCKISMKLDVGAEASIGKKPESSGEPIAGMENETGFTTGRKRPAKPASDMDINSHVNDFEYGE